MPNPLKKVNYFLAIIRRKRKPLHCLSIYLNKNEQAPFKTGQGNSKNRCDSNCREYNVRVHVKNSLKTSTFLSWWFMKINHWLKKNQPVIFIN